MSEVDRDSGIVQSTVGLLYPFIAVFSVYLMLNHTTPGGGFQGGSMFAALFIIRVLGLSVGELKVEALYRLEKLLLVFLALIPTIVLFSGLMPRTPLLISWYLKSVEILIGVNVSIGLTIVVFRFVFYTQED